MKFPAETAIEVVRSLLPVLRPVCPRLVVAGSLRRRKPEVGDIEFLYVPWIEKFQDPDDLFQRWESRNRTDTELDRLIADGTLAKRRNVNGAEMWGEKNKLAVHVASGIPVDLFSVLPSPCPCKQQPNCPLCSGLGWYIPCWWNQLVCRTGGAESNVSICQHAQRKGWKWNPYGPGFTRDLDGEIHNSQSERDVFEFVGLQCPEPWERQ